MLTERFELRLSPDLVARLDALRHQLPDLPSRAETVRKLIEVGLDNQHLQESVAEMVHALAAEYAHNAQPAPNEHTQRRRHMKPTPDAG